MRWLRGVALICKLVMLTRKDNAMNEIKRPQGNAGRPAWSLQDAKARFSKLVRRARKEGPQHVTVRGRPAVVVLSEEEYRRLAERRTGAELVRVLRRSPLAEVELEHERVRTPVRDVEL